MSIFSCEALFRKKPAGSDEAGKNLLKVLSALDLTLLGIGAIIGTGIFVLTGVAAATQSGPAVVISFVISGMACAFAALAYAELAACIGGCGSAYGYSYAAFGEVVAWIIGWDLILEYGVSVAAVANGWSGYLKGFFAALGLKFPLPDTLIKGPEMSFSWDTGPHIDFSHGIMNLPAMLIILSLMVLLIIGIKQSARLNAVMVFIKLMTVAVFIGVAMFHVQPELWHPFMPFGWFSTDPATGKTMGVLAGASVVFFAYVGFDAVSTAVEETRNPKRDVPIGILSSLVICTVLYIVVSGLLTGIVKYSTLNNSEPVAFALQQIGISWASGLVACGVVTGLTTVMLVLYYGLTRIIFAMSADGLLPSSLGVVNEKTHTPVKTTIICGIVMAIMAGVIPLGTLAELVNVGTLAAFVLVCAGVIMLRIKQPDMERPFKTPRGLIIPILGVLSCGALIAFLPFITHVRFVLWLVVGAIIYFSYSARHSRLGGGS